MRVLPSNNRGFTLVELMMAMLITMISLVGLLKALEVAMEHNARNLLRDEAVQVAEKAMSVQKTRPFGQMTSAAPASFTVASHVRNGSVSYTVTPKYSPYNDPTATSRLITVAVQWNYRGAPYSYQVMSGISQ